MPSSGRPGVCPAGVRFETAPKLVISIIPVSFLFSVQRESAGVWSLEAELRSAGQTGRAPTRSSKPRPSRDGTPGSFSGLVSRQLNPRFAEDSRLQTDGRYAADTSVRSRPHTVQKFCRDPVSGERGLLTAEPERIRRAWRPASRACLGRLRFRHAGPVLKVILQNFCRE